MAVSLGTDQPSTLPGPRTIETFPNSSPQSIGVVLRNAPDVEEQAIPNGVPLQRMYMTYL